MSWLDSLKNFVERRPIVVLKFKPDEWEQLVNSKRGVSEFTVALRHSRLVGVTAPVPCLMLGAVGNDEEVCFGVLASKSPITTLESRVKISRAVEIQPSTAAGLTALVTEAPHAKNFAARLSADSEVAALSPKLSSHLIDRLSSIQGNKGGLRAVGESLSVPRRFQGIAAQQEDAVQTALAVFGLSSGDQASRVDLIEGKETALGRVGIMEDSVVEHDARNVPGFALIESDVTGRALFVKGEEQLEVFTANRRDLEHCFGVDLIYINLTKKNVVMLQYKMLQAAGKLDDQSIGCIGPTRSSTPR